MSIAWNSVALAVIATGSIVASGCSDPVPPPAQGAVTFSVHRSGSQDCRIGSVSANAPEAPTGTATNVTGKRVGNVAIDGEGAKVGCRVAAAGNAFAVHATISTQNVTFALTGNIAERQEGANAHVSLQSLNTAAAYEQPIANTDMSSCTVTVRPDSTNSSYGIASGRIWGAFVCNQIRNASNGDTCTAEGTFVFENCEE